MLNQRMSECDELRLAGTCMRYMTSEEVIAGTDDMSAVHPMCWVIKMEEFEVERTLATNELTRALGQVVYLNNLAQVSSMYRFMVDGVDGWGMDGWIGGWLGRWMDGWVGGWLEDGWTLYVWIICAWRIACVIFLFQTPEDSAEHGSCPICTRLLGTEIVEVRVVIVCVYHACLVPHTKILLF